MGVGKKPHPDYDLKDWVLGKFTEEERAENVNIGVSLMKGNTELREAIDAITDTYSDDDVKRLLDDLVEINR